jgi:hypothetical protein
MYIFLAVRINHLHEKLPALSVCILYDCMYIQAFRIKILNTDENNDHITHYMLPYKYYCIHSVIFRWYIYENIWLGVGDSSILALSIVHNHYKHRDNLLVFLLDDERIQSNDQSNENEIRIFRSPKMMS